MPANINRMSTVWARDFLQDTFWHFYSTGTFQFCCRSHESRLLRPHYTINKAVHLHQVLRFILLSYRIEYGRWVELGAQDNCIEGPVIEHLYHFRHIHLVVVV